ncbi:MAG TPA: ATP-binding protein [Bacilli bacterium]|nr:ATP-binding protein [Bacilli bacterium]
MLRSIQWKLVILYLLVILAAMQLIGFYFIERVNEHFIKSFTDKVQGQVLVLADVLPNYLGDSSDKKDRPHDLNPLAESFANAAGAEINIIDANSVLIATSGNTAYLNKKSIQTQVTRSLFSGRSETTIKVDPKNGQHYLYLTIPVKDNNQILGVIYCVAPLSSVYQTIHDITVIFYTGTGIAVVLTAVLIIFLSRTITDPIVEITKKAGAMARGDFEQAVQVRSDDEIGQLGVMFNVLRQRLRTALAEYEQEKGKLEAVLQHMSDGVIAVGADDQILLANAAAAELLGVENIDDLLERPIESVIMLENEQPILSDEEAEWEEESGEASPPGKKEGVSLHEGVHDFIVEGSNGRILGVYTSPFLDPREEERGVVLVLRDITDEEREEQARRDFVANVSHEIRTPLTTVKSYIEALEDGAIESPQHAKRFLSVIHHETDRMVRLVSDLLQLSRLESGRDPWHIRTHNLRELVQNACFRFTMQLQRREVALSFEVPQGLAVEVDADKLDQVFDNLISNAIKYTADGGRIRVAAHRPSGKFVLVQIIDTGYGIPKTDLPQIFDRFYRVDKARSRQMGGTGLGLSIAKQIIEKHGGQIRIDSEEGQGTVVSFTLPVATGGADR